MDDEDSPLLRAFHILFRPELPDRELTPREKARVLVSAIERDTQTCLREQRHLIGQNPEDRAASLAALADSFTDTPWCPEGLSRDDVERAGPLIIERVVWCVANGHGLAGVESRLHALYTSSPIPQVPPLPPLRGERARSPGSLLRPRPRRGL